MTLLLTTTFLNSAYSSNATDLGLRKSNSAAFISKLNLKNENGAKNKNGAVFYNKPIELYYDKVRENINNNNQINNYNQINVMSDDQKKFGKSCERFKIRI